ncbi:UV DNA damage repair endonuclease UvsE [Desulfotalea psychrophila]|uniref:Related to UV-endonuclease n=1 Tax=Desulfotalea psychrophila (strain LSv54 / DSM 12343) TaxID=177439 RepID=Q6AL90_DESPS|nr:UV DNA damage repair endonuclease UvsE [Desulfotalea psychrophila]CAG36885.1 related to UV-endonuclease [Desulfotalea psychrophila LSv54]
MIRLGLCCIFREEPIRFRQTTATALKKTSRREQLEKLSSICLKNLLSLSKALEWVIAHEIGAFRVSSPLFPRFTHPGVGYQLNELPDHKALITQCDKIRTRRKESDIRLSLHPDQFNVLSSPHSEVVKNTIKELEYQGLLAELIGADVINIHGGGVYGDKALALGRLRDNFTLLSARVQTRLTLENDDHSYTPADLISVCDDMKIPFVYDVHHHRCLPDRLSIKNATTECVRSWNNIGREPLFHISTALNGYGSSKPQPHADFININDFPQEWLHLDATVEVEAKAKELAVLRLKNDLNLLGKNVH